MPTVVATVGGASSNSIGTVAQASAILDNIPTATSWENGDDDLKDRAVIEATSQLNALQWGGQRTNSTQALFVPRAYLENADNPVDANSLYFDDDIIPPPILKAWARLSFEIFAAGGTANIFAIGTGAGIKRKKVGPLETEYFGSYGLPSGIAKYPTIVSLIAPYLANARNEVSRA